MTNTSPAVSPSLATGAPLTADTFADFVKRLRHHVRGAGVNWHHTADAIFTVQAKQIDFGICRDYVGDLAVVVEDSMYFSPQEYWDDNEGAREQLDKLASDTYSTTFLELFEDAQWDILGDLDNHTLAGYVERWEHVNSHLTKEAAEAFIKRKKHDYPKGMRVYVEAQIYCWEFNAIIEGLMAGQIAFAEPAPASTHEAAATPNASELLALLIESQDSIGGDWRARRDAAVAAATAAGIPASPANPGALHDAIMRLTFRAESADLLTPISDRELRAYQIGHRDARHAAAALAAAATPAATYLPDAIPLLKRLKRNLMSARLHQPDVLNTYRRACTEAEGDIEVFFNECRAAKRAAAAATEPIIDPEAERIADDEEYPR